MGGHGSKLRQKKQLAISALIQNSSVKEAASAINVSESTIYRWLQDPSFLASFREAKKRIVEHAISRMQATCEKAVQVLDEVMGDPMTPASSRVTSAKIVLDMSLRTVEIEDIENRIRVLEERAEAEMMKKKRSSI
jgi:DNA-binding MurR/RpiR family transcriptional regulator